MLLSDTETEAKPVQAPSCTSCAGGVLRHHDVKTALWHGDELVVVEGVPALVCENCGERYFEDATALSLDMMRAERGSVGRPERTISVPVLRYVAAGTSCDKGETT